MYRLYYFINFTGYMRILHVIQDMETGGAQRLLTDLLPALAEDGELEITLAVYNSLSDSYRERLLRKNPRIRFIDLGIKKPRSLSPSFRLVSEVRRADVVHVHLFPPLYQMALTGLIAGTPLVFTEHSTHNRRRDHKWMRPLEQLIYSCYSALTTISEAVAVNLRNWLGNTGHPKIRIIPNGIDISRFNSEKPHPSLLPSLFGRGGKAILMVSRFAESKDQQTLIRAVPYLKDPEAFVAFAGAGETLEECRALAKSLGVGDRVMFLGERDDVERLMTAASIGVQSSNWEGFGLTAVEMMAAGLPVVASDVEGLRTIVENVGFLFPKGDEKALSEILNDLLAQPEDSEKLLRASKKGTQRALHHDIRTTARMYSALYRQLHKY